MDKQKFTSLGERIKLGGERLKTGGADLSRKLSGKMKEILQGPSQEAKMVDEATSDSLEEPNWGLNLRICGLLNNDQLNGSEVVRAIKKKITGKSVASQRLSLDLLEACSVNCDKVLSVVASERVIDDMVSMIENPQTDYGNRRRAFQLIEAWGKSDDLDYLPIFKQTYMNMKSKQDDGRLSLEPDHHVVVPPEGYPPFDLDQQDANPDLFAYHDATISEEEKKEVLQIAQNSIEILSSMMNSEEQSKDELASSILEKCKESQPIIQRIIESTTDNEPMLIEALSINDRLQEILSKYSDLKIDEKAEPENLDSDDSVSLEAMETKTHSSGDRSEETTGGPRTAAVGASNAANNNTNSSK